MKYASFSLTAANVRPAESCLKGVGEYAYLSPLVAVPEPPTRSKSHTPRSVPAATPATHLAFGPGVAVPMWPWPKQEMVARTRQCLATVTASPGQAPQRLGPVPGQLAIVSPPWQHDAKPTQLATHP